MFYILVEDKTLNSISSFKEESYVSGTREYEQDTGVWGEGVGKEVCGSVRSVAHIAGAYPGFVPPQGR